MHRTKWVNDEIKSTARFICVFAIMAVIFCCCFDCATRWGSLIKVRCGKVVKFPKVIIKSVRNFRFDYFKMFLVYAGEKFYISKSGLC